MTRIKPGILALAVALVLLLAAGTWTAARAYRAVEQARLLKAEVSGLKAELAAVDGLGALPAALETGRAGLASVEARYTELRREVAPFEGLLGWLGWVPAVGDDHHVGVVLAQEASIEPLHEQRRPASELAQALAVGQRPAAPVDVAVQPGLLEAVRPEHRGGVAIGDALQDAVVHLTKDGIVGDGPLTRDQLSGPRRPPEVTGEDGVELNRVQVAADRATLRNAPLVQLDVEVPLEHATGVRRRLSMSNQPKPHRSANYS